MPPKSETVATDISISIDHFLSTYTTFLTALGKPYDSASVGEASNDCEQSTMAAIFDPTNPASPLAYNVSQTALLLLDFQGLIIGRCGSEGQAAVAKAKAMRDWAFAHKIMVVHSVVDVSRLRPKLA